MVVVGLGGGNIDGVCVEVRRMARLDDFAVNWGFNCVHNWFSNAWASLTAKLEIDQANKVRKVLKRTAMIIGLSSIEL